MSKITKELWEAKGRELFGDDQKDWVFVCPACGNEESVTMVNRDHAADLQRLREADYRVEQECINRHLAPDQCNWCAYGLFRGPVIVDIGEGKDTAAFDFQGRPFSK